MQTSEIMEKQVLDEEKASREMIEILEKPFFSFFKRAFDIVASFFALLILVLPFLIICLVILIDDSGASPIFSQTRVGKNGKEFRFYKFRSMVSNAEELLEGLLAQNEMEGPAFKIKHDPRITRVGRFLRKTGLDELPQLINVLKGDMSLVGPRPPLPREVEQYDDYQRQRLAIMPGITCYWQIARNRNSLTFDEWVALDIKYIQKRSVRTDIAILFQTVLSIFRLEGS